MKFLKITIKCRRERGRLGRRGRSGLVGDRRNYPLTF